MKKIMKTVSLIMAIIMLVQVPLAANAAFDAPTLTRGEWDELYEDYCDENTLPMLCVGAYESSVSLVWHADKDKAQPKVRLAEKKNMDGYKEFTGKTTEAENDDQVVCRVIIDGLKENTTYYYKWYSDNGWSKAYKYETKSFTDHKAIP